MPIKQASSIAKIIYLILVCRGLHKILCDVLACCCRH